MCKLFSPRKKRWPSSSDLKNLKLLFICIMDTLNIYNSEYRTYLVVHTTHKKVESLRVHVPMPSFSSRSELTCFLEETLGFAISEQKMSSVILFIYFTSCSCCNSEPICCNCWCFVPFTKMACFSSHKRHYIIDRSKRKHHHQ